MRKQTAGQARKGSTKCKCTFLTLYLQILVLNSMIISWPWNSNFMNHVNHDNAISVNSFQLLPEFFRKNIHKILFEKQTWNLFSLKFHAKRQPNNQEKPTQIHINRFQTTLPRIWKNLFRNFYHIKSGA